MGGVSVTYLLSSIALWPPLIQLLFLPTLSVMTPNWSAHSTAYSTSSSDKAVSVSTFIC